MKFLNPLPPVSADLPICDYPEENESDFIKPLYTTHFLATNYHLEIECQPQLV